MTLRPTQKLWRARLLCLPRLCFGARSASSDGNQAVHS